jgi:hypothetical protein
VEISAPLKTKSAAKKKRKNRDKMDMMAVAKRIINLKKITSSKKSKRRLQPNR